MNPKNLHLTISLALVVVAALMYGLAPSSVVPVVFDIDVETVDLSNVFRVIMCVYLAVAGTWLYGILKPQFWHTATLTNILFMGSVTSGRLISLVFDGVPSITLIFALLGELALTVYAVIQYRRYRSY